MDRLSTSNKIYIKIEHTMAWDESSKDYFTFNDTDCHTCGKPKAECCCQDCNPCAKKERECCVPNIVPDWDCIKVETDSEWVIHLSTRCNPKITSEDKSVTVKLDESWDVDVWDLSVKDMNNFVWACAADKHPSTLDEKIVWVSPITVTPVCSDNGQIEIGIDLSDIETDNNKVAVDNWCREWYLYDVLKSSSSYVELQKQWCTYVLVDKENQSHYYAKLVLKNNHIVNVNSWNNDFEEKYLGEKSDISWNKVWWEWTINVRSSLLSWLKFVNWTPWNPWLWKIAITRKWLYQVWFSWSAEFSYWVHAFRIQLYRDPEEGRDPETWESVARNTIVESRYSWPIWYQPWQNIVWSWWDINFSYVSWVSTTTEGTVRNVSHNTYSKKLDYPLISDKTEVWGMIQQQVYSQSLWASFDRVTVTWNTIVELDVWDWIYVWLKVSTEVDHTWWEFLNKVTADRFKNWQLALLWVDAWQSDNGWEAWFSFYANLIHPLV